MTDELMITHDRPMLDEAGLDLIFRQARTHSAWTDRPIAEELLREIYELAKWGPTAMNGSPTRFCESVNVIPSHPWASARWAWATAVPVSGIRMVHSSMSAPYD